MTSRIPKLALSVAAVLACANFATAQTTYLDHVVDSTFTNAAALDSLSIGEASALQLVPAGWESALAASRAYYLGGSTTADKDGKAVATPIPFLKSAIFSVQYGYSQIGGSITGYGTRSDLNSVTPELYLESTGGLSLDLAYSYTDDGRSNSHTFGKHLGFRDSSDTSTNGVSVQVAQDLLRAFSRKSKDTLNLGLLFTYNNNDEDFHFPFGHTFVSDSYDAYRLTPSLVYVHPFSSSFSGTLAGTYLFRWVDSSYIDGVLTILGRGDYKVAKNVTAYASAAWNHYESNTGGSNYNYGVFGAGVRWDCCKNVGVKVGYEYTAFLPITDEHSVVVRAEYHF